MFEHMKNYKLLMAKISSWLRPNTSQSAEGPLFFAQIFCHKTTPYHFEEGDGWMAQNFFSGASFPSAFTKSAINFLPRGDDGFA